MTEFTEGEKYWGFANDKCPNCGSNLEIQYEVRAEGDYGIQERCPKGDWKHIY